MNMQGSIVEPTKLRSLVSSYSEITKVEGFTDAGFPFLLSLEVSLDNLLGEGDPIGQTATRSSEP